MSDLSSDQPRGRAPASSHLADRPRPTAVIQPETTSTAGMADKDAMGLWEELLTTYHCLMSCEFPSEDKFTANAFRSRTALHQLVCWTSDPVIYRRSIDHIRRDACDAYRLLVPLSGAMTFVQASHQTRLATGTASLLTFSRPFLLHNAAPARQAILTIGREQIEARINGPVTVLMPLDLTTGLGSVLRSMLESLIAQHHNLTPSEFNAVVDRLVELLCMLLSGSAMPVGPGQLALVEAAVHRYVRLHAEESDLSGETIARALGWSLRQIQLALKESGTTPREVIREERLALARDRLTSAAFSQVSIREIAHRCGFTSVSVFSTAFRQRFGIAPRELRRSHCQSAHGDASGS